MLIYPAIDIMDGKAVRLTKGAYASAEVLDDNPFEVAKRFLQAGATCLHLVDLDGAKSGELSNFETIGKIATNLDMFIEVGGGIRDEERIKTYLSVGVDRVILGTIAIKDFAFVEAMVKKYGDKIAVGIDCKDGYVAVSAWEEVSAVSGFDFAKKCLEADVKTIIYTDIDTDGAMQGTNMQAFEELSQLEGLNVIASGGVSFEKELYQLNKLNVHGVILGKAIYKGLIDLSRAVKIANGEL